MGNFFNKRQRVASLLDDASLAMGFNEPTNDGYKDVYDQLTPKEKELSIRHPYLALSIKENMRKAFENTWFFEGETNGYGDAIRHCYWCALNQIDAGLNSPLAKEFGDAHESKPNNDSKEKAMDLHNNAVGYYLGNQAIINNWSEQELLNNVINAAKNGKLQIGL